MAVASNISAIVLLSPQSAMPDVVGLGAAAELGVRREIVGIELVDHVESRERREELPLPTAGQPKFMHRVQAARDAGPDERRVVVLVAGRAGQPEEHDVAS